MSAPRRQPRPLTRREFLRRSAALSAVAASATIWTPGRREAWARTRGSVVRPEGTTLERFIWFETTDGELVHPDGYTPLRYYEPGWPIEVRAELAEPKRGREGRRVALTAFAQGTDYQFPDAQSPARVEFLARYADEPTPSFLSSAQRPQEALIVQATEALHRQIRQIGVGPVTGRRLDFAIATGDNYDNKQLNELEWFITLMNGGPMAPNSGAPDAFEGVQNFDGNHYDDWYYHPDPDIDTGPLGRDRDERDNYVRRGYPDHPGILEAAIQGFSATGLGLPWYQTYGNHDSLVQGNERVNDAYAEIVVGSTKVLHPADFVPFVGSPGTWWRAFMEQDPGAVAIYASLPTIEVTPDEDRRFIFDREYVQAHIDSGGSPTGHGFDEWNVDNIYLFYTFDVAESILGISLDTCAPLVSNGAIGDAQLDWLEEQLISAHSHYYDTNGEEVRTGNEDRLVILFGHHRFASMGLEGEGAMQGQRQIGGPDDDDDAPGAFRGPDGYVYRLEQQHGAEELLALLHRFPNVIAYVNGHSHRNIVEAFPDTSGRTAGFWEITTSAILDPPQHGRIIEVADNRDGTLSIFTTLVDHAGPVGAESYDVLGLAAISRELGFNDYQAGVEGKVGAAKDRNVELILPAPFDLHPSAGRKDRPAEGAQPALPATGGGVGLAGLGAAALTGAIALRERGSRNDETEPTDRS